jgi:hypothetical protein
VLLGADTTTDAPTTPAAAKAFKSGLPISALATATATSVGLLAAATKTPADTITCTPTTGEVTLMTLEPDGSDAGTVQLGCGDCSAAASNCTVVKLAFAGNSTVTTKPPISWRTVICDVITG